MQWFVEERLFYNTMVQKKRLSYHAMGKERPSLNGNLPHSLLRTEVAGW